jgi:hypothetical protein
MLLTFGGVLLLSAILLFANRDGDEDAGDPSIAVDQQSIDYGDVKFGISKAFAIKVTNTGNGKLRFEEKPYIDVLEGC